MNIYGRSSVIGYESHLHTRYVRLPLKYAEEMDQVNTVERFENKYYVVSELLDISSQAGLFFTLVQIGVTKDLKTIRLTPLLVDEATSLGVQLQLIEISLPHPLSNKDTFTYQFIPLIAEEEPYILIDVLDQNFLLISLRIELSDFLMGNSKNRLMLDNFSDWVNISVPYSFELRSPPFLVKHLDPQNLIVSMKDGGLLHFKRSGPLSTFDIFNFSDIIPYMSFNILGGLFASSNNTEISVDGFSSNCVVDLVPISDTQFVTLSVNKVLKIWDKETHRQNQDHTQLSDSHSSSDWLTTLPNKYLQVYESKKGKNLSILLPNQPFCADNVVRFGYEFVTFSIQTGGTLASPQEASRLALSNESLEKYYQPLLNDAQVFRVQDFHVIEEDQELTYAVLWKSHTFSETVCYRQLQNSSDLTMLRSSIPKSNHNILTEFNAHIEPEAYLNTLFNSGLYDEPIIRTALEAFSKSCELSSVAYRGNSLRQRVRQAVHQASKNQDLTDGSCWFKFALICAQFRKTSSEALSVLQYQGYILSAQANGIEILAEPHYYQTFMHSKSELANLLKKVSAAFSTQSYRVILNEILKISEPIDALKATELATKHFSDKISENQVNEFTEELASIRNVLDELKELTSVNGHFEQKSSELSFAGQGSGLLAKLAAIDTFENIRKAHESILITIFVLLLLCEVNDQVLEFLNLILNRFKAYNLMTQIFGLCFVSTGGLKELEKDSVCLMENSIFWPVAVNKNCHLQKLLLKKNWNTAFDFYCNNIILLRQDEYILDLVLELINRGEGEIILDTFATKMDKSHPLNVFLLGLIYLINNQVKGFLDIFANYANFKHISREKKLVAKLLESLDGIPEILNFLKSIFKESSSETLSESNYFHLLSQLMQLCGARMENGRQYRLKSLEFEKEAFDILQHHNNEKEGLSEKHSRRKLMTLYLRNYFHDAVEIEKFDDAINSLSHLQTLASKEDFRVYMTRIVKAILSHHKAKRLFTDFFAKSYLLVDSIILELANEDLILSKALRYYELLYSWRLFGASPLKQELGDKRGAVEGLYIFVSRFKGEMDCLAMNSGVVEDFKQFKLKILELYKIILNTLKTFGEERDRWIRRRSPNSDRLSVVKVNELNVEYYQWLKELERDFAD